MSTMRVTNLKHENSASNNIVLNSDGSVGGDLATTLASKLDLAGGKILQIVRATDVANRNTTSLTYVDVSGSTVSITPQKSDSAIIIIWSFFAGISSTANGDRGRFQITDASNNAISGAEDQYFGDAVGTTHLQTSQTLIGYSTPATTSAVTYKGRFCTLNVSSSVNIVGTLATTQLYAIEVSA